MKTTTSGPGTVSPAALAARLVLGLLLLAASSVAAPARKQSATVAGAAVAPVLSPPLRDIPPVTGANEKPHLIENQPLPMAGRAANQATPVDPVIQVLPGNTLINPTGVNFDGAPENAGAPPDTNGRVGPNHYVQWVNTRFSIYTKTGTLLYGPADGKTLWQSLGGTCAIHNDGDPIAQYDLMADRWVLSRCPRPATRSASTTSTTSTRARRNSWTTRIGACGRTPIT
jgi:hypothetical protein